MSNVAFAQMNQAQFGNVSRFSGSTQFAGYSPIDDGGDAYAGKRTARAASNGNFIGTVLTVAAVGVAAIAGMALTKKIFTPAILKNITSLEAIAGAEANTIVKGAYKFASKEGEQAVTGTVKYLDNTGFLGFFRKAEIAVEGGATRTVGMWRVPSELKTLLKTGPDALGSPMFWGKVGDAGLKLGGETLSAGAAQATNVYGQVIGAVKKGANEFVIHAPDASGAYVAQTVTYDALPAALRRFFIAG